MFREILEERWRGEDATRPKGGRPAWDAVLMFKILLIGKKTGYSDERLEWAIVDSASLKRFLGIDHGDRVPDRTTIYRYRNALDENNLRELFDCFGDMLVQAGYRAQEGQILDSTFVLTPIQRNSRDKNATIKCGKSHYGYKNHIAVDAMYKLIEAWIVTPANAHDVTVVEELVSQTRASIQVGMQKLMYNMQRLVSLRRMAASC